MEFYSGKQSFSQNLHFLPNSCLTTKFSTLPFPQLPWFNRYAR